MCSAEKRKKFHFQWDREVHTATPIPLHAHFMEGP